MKNINSFISAGVRPNSGETASHSLLRRLGSLAAGVVVAASFSIGGANAAMLSTTGGFGSTKLGSDFSFGSANSALNQFVHKYNSNITIGANTTVKYTDGILPDALLVKPDTTQPFRFTYLGSEASDFSVVFAPSDAKDPLFTKSSAVGSTYDVRLNPTDLWNSDAGYVPFKIVDKTGNTWVENGNFLLTNARLALYKLTDLTYLVFFDDGRGSDRDYDDMIFAVSVMRSQNSGFDTPTPVPAALPLFGGGLALLGLLGRRRKDRLAGAA